MTFNLALYPFCLPFNDLSFLISQVSSKFNSSFSNWLHVRFGKWPIISWWVFKWHLTVWAEWLYTLWFSHFVLSFELKQNFYEKVIILNKTSIRCNIFQELRLNLQKTEISEHSKSLHELKEEKVKWHTKNNSLHCIFVKSK